MFLHPQPLLPDTEWQDALSPGDIVLFRFPVSDPENGGSPAKSRPCLVLDTHAIAGKHFVTLAYGTSIRSRANRGHEIIVRDPSSQQRAGLDKPTYFIGSRRVTVGVDHPGFDLSRAHVTPVIGKLDDVLMDRLHGVRARIHAIADYHAEQRRLRQEEQDRWDAEGRGFSERNRVLRASNNPMKGNTK